MRAPRCNLAFLTPLLTAPSTPTHPTTRAPWDPQDYLRRIARCRPSSEPVPRMAFSLRKKAIAGTDSDTHRCRLHRSRRSYFWGPKAPGASVVVSCIERAQKSDGARGS